MKVFYLYCGMYVSECEGVWMLFVYMVYER